MTRKDFIQRAVEGLYSTQEQAEEYANEKEKDYEFTEADLPCLWRMLNWDRKDD